MAIEAQIVDQRVAKVVDDRQDAFAKFLGIRNDLDKLRSAAFVFVVTKSLLDLGEAETFDCMVEGGNDFAVDAIHVGTPRGGEFPVTLVQGKYKRRMDGQAAFPENAVVSMLAALGSLFDPEKIVDGNVRLIERLASLRQAVAEGYIPRVVVVLCNNGRRWSPSAQRRIDQDQFGRAVSWYHIGPEELVKLLRPAVQIDATVQLSGSAIVESFDFRRALIGRISVGQLASLFDAHGDQLLDRNIRRYVGLAGNRVNEGIAATLRDPARRQNFYFYNNGITIICTQFRYNALQAQNWQVQLHEMQIINGGQTCRTIQKVVDELGPEVGAAQVMLRIYELPKEDQELVYNITFATNSQNPVSLRDLKSNDDKQRMLEHSIGELGYVYRRQRSDAALAANEFEVETIANAILIVWRDRRKPRTVQSVLDEFYEIVFTDDLNAAQAVIAARILQVATDLRLQTIRIKEEEAKKEGHEKEKNDARKGKIVMTFDASLYYFMMTTPEVEPIAAHMGAQLLTNLKLDLASLTHVTFAKANDYINQNGETLFKTAFKAVEKETTKGWTIAPKAWATSSTVFHRPSIK
jgi:hypothetical protein